VVSGGKLVGRAGQTSARQRAGRRLRRLGVVVAVAAGTLCTAIPTASSAPVASTAPVTTEPWSTSGPPGGRVSNIVVDPTNPRQVYAATYTEQVYWSADAGADWHVADIFGQNNFDDSWGLAVDPNTGQVYAATLHGDVFRSDDDGRSWGNGQPVGAVGEPVNGLAVNEDGIVFAAAANFGSGGGLVRRSSDHGATWTDASSGLPQGEEGAGVSSILVDGSVLYAGTQGVYTSVDGGDSWNSMNDGLPVGTSATALAVGPDHAVYAGISEQGIWRFDQSDQAWSDASDGLPPEDPAYGQGTINATALVVDPLTPTTLYAAVGRHGVYRSISDPPSWSPIDTGLPSWSGFFSLAIDPEAPSRLYAGSATEGLYRTVDGGTTWEGADAGLYANTARDIAVDPVDPSIMYAAGGDLFRSTDRGMTWQVVNARGECRCTYFLTVAVDPHDHSIVYAGGEGVPGASPAVYRSNDGGDSWAPTSLLIEPLDSRHQLGTLTVDDAGTVWVGEAFAGWVDWSQDGGETWNSAQVAVQQIRGIVAQAPFVPGGPETVYVADPTDVFRSTDGGATWDPFNEGLALNADLQTPLITNLVGTSAAGGTLYANDYTGGIGVFKSVGGGNWQATSDFPNNDSPITIAIDPVDEGVVYAAGASNSALLYRTEDGGQTWSPMYSTTEPGVPSGNAIFTIASDGQPVPRVLVGTFRAIYWSGPPSPPRDVSAAAGDGEALVTWVPPEFDGGSPVSSYSVTVTDETDPGSSPAPLTDVADTQVVVPGLVNDDAYSFSVTATNGIGESDPSSSGSGTSVVGSRVRAAAESSDSVVPRAHAAPPDGKARQLSPSGGVIATGGAATSRTNPVATSVDANVQGGAAVTEGALSAKAPSGSTFVGQEVEIKTPRTFFFEPLRQAFTLDASLVPPQGAGAFSVYRSDSGGPPTLVRRCTVPGKAVPDPCVASRSLTSSGQARIVTLASHANSRWRFALPTELVGPSLTVARKGTGAGAVTSSPAGIDCPTRCAVMEPEGSTVTLTATAKPGSVFTGWSGACAGTDPCQLTMGATRSAAATFTLLDTTITSGPSGTVASHSATFSFSASIDGSTFQCSLDGSAFKACSTPKTYRRLAAGGHVFKVRARDAGTVDRTPASRAWTVG
jgi:Fibronectin type III domain/Divergent InlB B-repeat domain